MKKILEDLWYTYLSQIPAEPTAERQLIAKDLAVYESRLRDGLSPAQRADFLQYERCINAIDSMAECDAFIRGVRFATRLLLETIL